MPPLQINTALSEPPIEVPQFVGLDRLRAERLAARSGLIVDQVVFEESTHARDVVVRQEPTGGSFVAGTTRVMLAVARKSYARALPLLYTQPGSQSLFIRDLLWIIQHLLGSIEDLITSMPRCLRAETAPRHLLTWLAGWTAVALDDTWSEERTRHVLARACELYALRGTALGLSELVRLATDCHVTIEENRWPLGGVRVGHARVGVDSMLLPQARTSRAFIVRVAARREAVSDDTIAQLHRVICAEKPAHTHYALQFLSPVSATNRIGRLTVGVHRIGLDRGGKDGEPAQPNLCSKNVQADSLLPRILDD